MAKGDDDSRRENYEVGYRRPPPKHQIKPGEIRNPNGRRGKRHEPDFMEELFEVRVDGKIRKVSRKTAVDFALFQEAMKGNVSAAKELESRWRRRNLETKDSVEDEVVTSDNQAALDRYVERRMREKAAGEKANGHPEASASLSAPQAKK